MAAYLPSLPDLTVQMKKPRPRRKGQPPQGPTGGWFVASESKARSPATCTSCAQPCARHCARCSAGEIGDVASAPRELTGLLESKYLETTEKQH